MAERIVVGLFQSEGIAEDAVHRLRTEGVPARDLTLHLLHETAPLPTTSRPEMDALAVDPMVWGNALKTFAPLIHNGETAVFVRAGSDERVEFARETLRQYVPLSIEILSPARAAQIEETDRPARD